MAVFSGPKIVNNGLLLQVDAANLKSYDSNENLLVYSEDISQYNSIDKASVSTNQIAAPDGTLTADKLISTIPSGNNTCWVQRLTGVAIDTSTYTFSVFLKAGTSPQTLINLQLSGGTYQQSTATITWASNTITASSGGTAELTAYPNGWYRLSITLTNNGTNNIVAPRVYVRGQGSGNVDGEYVYVWGLQLEKGSSVGPYYSTPISIKTRGATWTDLISGAFSLVNSSYYAYSANNNGYISFSRTMPSATETGGYASRSVSGALSALTYFHNNHTTEVWFFIKNTAPTNYDATETSSALLVHAGYHGGFEYTSDGISYLLWGNNGSGGWTTNAVGISTPAANTWNQIVATRNGPTLSMYLNGVLRTTGTITLDSSTTPTSNTLRIATAGDSAGPYSHHADVNVSLARMYNIALTAAEVDKNFNATRGRFGI